MMKQGIVTLCGVVFFLGLSTLGWAADKECACHKRAEGPAVTKDAPSAVNVGNKICPVMGLKVDERHTVTYEHEGKIYNFCCAGCITAFQQNPGTYIDKVEKELNAEQGRQENQQPNTGHCPDHCH